MTWPYLERAERLDSYEGWNDYLENCPKGAKAEEARGKAGAIALNLAQNAIIDQNEADIVQWLMAAHHHNAQKVIDFLKKDKPPLLVMESESPYKQVFLDEGFTVIERNMELPVARLQVTMKITHGRSQSYGAAGAEKRRQVTTTVRAQLKDARGRRLINSSAARTVKPPPTLSGRSTFHPTQAELDAEATEKAEASLVKKLKAEARRARKSFNTLERVDIVTPQRTESLHPGRPAQTARSEQGPGVFMSVNPIHFLV